MGTRWQTFPVSLKGGLVTNISPLQQGVVSPGSARVLINFEPSIEGGYRRIEGYSKYDTNYVPPYGFPLVDGGSQTGTSIDLDALEDEPSVGDTLTIEGVTGTYEIAAGGVSYNSGTKSATLTLTTSLNSSPADNAAITFSNTSDTVLGVSSLNGTVLAVRNSTAYRSTGAAWVKMNTTNRSIGSKVRWDRYKFSGTDTIIAVDSTNPPFKFDGSTWTELTVPTEVQAASHVIEFKNHIFYAQSNTIVFSAPFSDTDYTVANGGGSLFLPSDITGMIVFRDQLIIFCRNKIFRLSGDTVSSFEVSPISDDIGCVQEDTIQEVGGDIMFLGPDGLRLLSATERIGDFGFAVASRSIQEDVINLRREQDSFTSCVVRSKSQYRLFGYKTALQYKSSTGFIGTQFADQDASGMAWSKLKGIKAYCADSAYNENTDEELILFSNESGFVYVMESGNTFDGDVIRASFHTPFFSIDDPRRRKTVFKVHTYVDPDGEVVGDATLKFDFDQVGLIQPNKIMFSSSANAGSRYGTAVYGVSRYSGKLTTIFSKLTIGSGFNVSVQYEFNTDSPPFSLDTVVLEYSTEGKQ